MGRTKLILEILEEDYKEIPAEYREHFLIQRIEPVDPPDYSNDELWSKWKKEADALYKKKKQREEELKNNP